MPATPSPENSSSPTSGLTPIRLAAAAPGNALRGKACAAKDAPRNTTKNPTTPATAATSEAAIQALIMKSSNTDVPRRPGNNGIGPDNEGHDTETHRPAMAAGPFVAVIGDQNPTPGRRDAD